MTTETDVAEAMAFARKTVAREQARRQTHPACAQSTKNHSLRRQRCSTRRDQKLDPGYSAVVTLPGCDPIPWTGIEPPPTPKLQRVKTPVTIDAQGNRADAVFEDVIFRRSSIVDGVHAYEELS